MRVLLPCAVVLVSLVYAQPEDSVWTVSDSWPLQFVYPGSWLKGVAVDNEDVWVLWNQSLLVPYRVVRLDRLTGGVRDCFEACSLHLVTSGIARFADSLLVSVREMRGSGTCPEWFHLYDIQGNFVREFEPEGDRRCRGLDWDGEKFWVAHSDTGGRSTIYTMTREGQVLREFVRTGPGMVAYIMDLCLDLSSPGHLWLTDGQSTTKTHRVRLDTVAGTYEVLASYDHPSSRPSGLGYFLEPGGQGYLYTVGVEAPWLWQVLVCRRPGIEEEGEVGTSMCGAGIMRAIDLARLDCRVLDIQGRDVTDRRERLAPGVYFIGEGSRGRGFEDSRVRKVIVQR